MNKKLTRKIGFYEAIVYCSLLFFSGCTNPLKKAEITQPVVTVNKVPSPPVEKLEELILDKIEDEKEVEKLFSFVLRDEDIRQVLLALSRQVPYNIIVNPDVSGNITLEMKDITLREALDHLTSLMNLEYDISGKNIKISRQKMETRLFTLNYVNTIRTGTGTIESVTGVSDALIGGGGGGGSDAKGGGSIETGPDITDIWTELAAGLQNMLSEGGRIVINKVSSVIMVTDFLPNLNRVADFLERVEGSAQRQVMILAKIVEVTLDDEYKTGLDWSALRDLGGGITKGNLTGGKIFSQALSLNASDDVESFQIGTTNLDFTVLVEAFSEQGVVNIRSSPKISTLNNQKAVIKVGRDEVFFDPSYNAVTSTNPNTGQITSTSSVLTSVQPRTVTVGVVLDVTPQISRDGYIVMTVHPSVTELVRIEQFTQTTDGETNVFATAPVIDIRETDTVVRVRDGQTIIIAGMMQDKNTETITKVPILGDIPYIDTLFKKTDRKLDKTELVILITPKIMIGRQMEDIPVTDEISLEKFPKM